MKIFRWKFWRRRKIFIPHFSILAINVINSSAWPSWIFDKVLHFSVMLTYRVKDHPNFNSQGIFITFILMWLKNEPLITSKIACIFTVYDIHPLHLIYSHEIPYLGKLKWNDNAPVFFILRRNTPTLGDHTTHEIFYLNYDRFLSPVIAKSRDTNEFLKMLGSWGSEKLSGFVRVLDLQKAGVAFQYGCQMWQS